MTIKKGVEYEMCKFNSISNEIFHKTYTCIFIVNFLKFMSLSIRKTYK